MGDQNKLPACTRDCDVQAPIIEHKVGSPRTYERENHDVAFASLKPLKDSSLKRVFASIGSPEKRKFEADPFQLKAVV